MVFQGKKSVKPRRFYILGIRGYLGSNIATHLAEQGLEVYEIDPRITKLPKLSLSNGDWIIDCSRLKRFTEDSLLVDMKIFREVLAWADLSKGRFLRIGSILELQNEGDVSPYIKWSSERTKELTKANLSGKFGTLIVPNIFGGSESTSILDLILRKHKSGQSIYLEQPDTFRDFLHVQFLLESIDNLIAGRQTLFQNASLISSGVSYQVGSICDYVYSREKNQLVSIANEYNRRHDCRLFPDKVLNYIENF
jgi:hypothetical protein